MTRRLNVSLRSQAEQSWQARPFTGIELRGKTAVVLGMGGSALRGLSFGKPLVVQGERGFWELLTPETLDRFLWQGWYGVGSGTEAGRENLISILGFLLDNEQERAQLEVDVCTLHVDRRYAIGSHDANATRHHTRQVDLHNLTNLKLALHPVADRAVDALAYVLSSPRSRQQKVATSHHQQRELPPDGPRRDGPAPRGCGAEVHLGPRSGRTVSGHVFLPAAAEAASWCDGARLRARRPPPPARRRRRVGKVWAVRWLQTEWPRGYVSSRPDGNSA